MPKLNILPNKSWHVYSKKNRERVEVDEQKHKQKVKEKHEENSAKKSIALYETLKPSAKKQSYHRKEKEKPKQLYKTPMAIQIRGNYHQSTQKSTLESLINVDRPRLTKTVRRMLEEEQIERQKLKKKKKKKKHL